MWNNEIRLTNEEITSLLHLQDRLTGEILPEPESPVVSGVCAPPDWQFDDEMDDSYLHPARAQLETIFRDAVKENNIPIIQELLRHGISNDYLSFAGSSGHLAIVGILLDSREYGHHYNVTQAVDVASKKEDYIMVSFIVSKISNENMREELAGFSFMLSVMMGHANLPEQLLLSGLPPIEKYLETAVTYKRLDLVKWIVERMSQETLATVNMDNLFHRACLPIMKGSTEVVKYLLENGADINSVGTIWGSALRLAAGSRQPELLEFLIENGADIEASGDFGGNNPLMIAAAVGDAQTVRILLDHGADMYKARGAAGNILQTACFLGRQEVVAELLDRGFGINERIEPWDSPLLLAIKGRRPDLVYFLLAHGADVNFQNVEDGNALYFAAMHGLTGLVRALIGAGADVNARGGKYGSALQVAIFYRHAKIALILLDHGASMEGIESGILAAAHGFPNVRLVEILLSHTSRTKEVEESSLRPFDYKSLLPYRKSIKTLLD